MMLIERPNHAQGAPLRGRRPDRRGFALIVTLSLMVLLVLLAVGMLGLSSVSMRSAGQGMAQAEAQANARLALMLALGDLQKHTGPDTRITAPADILDADNPPLIGAWRSWEGTNHETSGAFAGRPVTPDYGVKLTPESEGGRFLGWLVSGPDGGLAEAATLVNRSSFENSVPLIATGTLAAGDLRQVHLVPQAVNGSGSLAWWVSAENQKARLPNPYQPDDQTSAARWSVIAKSHAVADPQPFGLESLLDDPSPAAKAFTLGTADLFASNGTVTKPGQFFHDLSATSLGLLTNTATGGWRKDLSLITENWDNQPKRALPFFQITPTVSSAASIPTLQDSYPAGAILYPWAAYRPISPLGNRPMYRQGAVSSWENLKDYATHYKRVSIGADGRMSTAIHSRSIGDGSADGHFSYTHRVRVLPVIARMQWVFSHSAALLPKASAGDPDRYEPRLLLTPVITMWNPYKVQITSPASMNINVDKAMPPALRYTIDGTENPKYHSVMAGENNRPSLGGGALRFNISAPFTLIPGETRLFSPSSTTPVASGSTITVSPGYRTGGGHYYPVKGPDDQPMSVSGDTSIKVAAKFDTAHYDFGPRPAGTGVGMYLNVGIPGQHPLAYRMTITPEMANAVYPEIAADDLAGVTSGDLPQTVSNPMPFLSTIFGARTASNTHLAAKGYLQSSPLVNYTALGHKDEAHPAILRHYGGTGHPVNAPFDYSFVRHTGAGDSFMPNIDARNRGYIVTGFTQANGLSRCAIVELPLRPLVSLAELTHWDARFENPIPPFALNIIANSDATPLLPSDKVVNVNDANLAANLQYDDSYCANHLLFDDWFVSSITPDPNNFGSAGRSQRDTYAAFLKGETPLANRAYRPLPEDRAAAADTDALYADYVEPVDAWRTIASRLEVDGMFNVNSTSVTAWRALLGHARDQRVAHIRESGGGWDIGLSDPSDHVWSRFSVAADTEAGTAGSSGAFREATEFAGYRTVDDDLLDALAEEVVAQIRQRGPFLSLAEFVNRQLSEGDLALAGAIQAALNALAENTATDPLTELKHPDFSAASVADPPSPAGVPYDDEYQFPEAAVGHSSYGLPGWTRQADILRPLAPILSARDDTFTIRVYGDARDTAGKVIAHAWCEATVRRSRDFVDPADPADSFDAPVDPINQLFGRRYEIVSFRWLSPDEV